MITAASRDRNAGRFVTLWALSERNIPNTIKETSPVSTIVGEAGVGGDGVSGNVLEADIVTTFRVTAMLPDPVGLTEAGLTEQVELSGAPEQAKLTSLLNPPLGEIRKSKEAVPPALIVEDAERAAIEKSRPIPESATVWRPLEAPPLMVRRPESGPAAEGSNVTLIVQLPPGATEAPQVFVSAKFTPTVTLLIVITVDPLFVTLTL